MCQVQTSVYRLLSYLDQGAPLVPSPQPEQIYEFTPSDGIPLALASSDSGKGGLEAAYVLTRSAVAGAPGQVLAIDVSSQSVGFALSLSGPPRAFDLARTDSSAGNPQDLTLLIGYDGRVEQCSVDLSGATAYQINNVSCTSVNVGGTVVAIRSRPPHDGQATVVTTGPDRLLEVNFALGTVQANKLLQAAPTALAADFDFAWVTVGTQVQKFDHGASTLEPVQVVNLGQPARALAATGDVASNGQALVTSLAVATQSPAPSQVRVFSFVDGNLVSLPASDLNQSGQAVAMQVRSFQTQPFAYVAVQGTDPAVWNARLVNSPNPVAQPLPPGAQPLDMSLTAPNADPNAAEQDENCQAQCSAARGFLHVLVRQ